LPLIAIDCRGSPRAQMSTVDEMNKSSVLAEKQKKRMMRFLEVVNVLVKGLPAHEVCAHSQRAAMECTDSTGAAVFICRDERAKDVLPPGKVDLDAFLGDEKKPGADKEGGGDRGLRRQSSMSAVVEGGDRGLRRQSSMSAVVEGGDRGLRRQSSMSAVVDESVAIEIEALRNDAYTQQAQLQASSSYGVVKEAELVQVMATDGE
jgi:hypothetical protein